MAFEMLRRVGLLPMKETRAPNFIQGQITPWGNWGSSTTAASGVAVNVTSAQQLLAVYGCVQLIAGTISTLPRHLMREDRSEVTQKPKWFDKPNEYTTMQEFISQTVTSLLLNGNAYWVYGIDGNLMPNELSCLDPAIVTVNQKPGPVSPVVSYEVNGKPFRGKMLHLKGICAPGAAVGISPIEAAKQSIGVGLAAQEFAGRFYSNGAALQTVIKVKGDIPTLEQARETVRKFEGDHQGLKNAHRTGLIDNDGDIITLGVPPEQAQFLESRQFQAAEICSQMFLVDPAWFGMALGTGSNVTYANLESQGVRLATFTLTRWLVTLERAFYELLPRPQELKFNLDGLKRGDLAARADYYTKALDPATGWMVRPEVRELEDLGKLPANAFPQPQAPPQLQAVPAPSTVNG